MAEPSPIRALLIDADPRRAGATRDLLGGAGAGQVDLLHVDQLVPALEQLARDPYDVVLFALPPAGDDARERIDRLLMQAPGVPVIVLAGAAAAGLALPLIRYGAQDVWVEGRDSGEALLRAMHFALARKPELNRLLHQANHDLSTGLPNRYLFEDRLAHAAARATRSATPLALLFLDMDGFKQVNDRLGHIAGDRVLRRIAGRLMRTVRESDTVARLGGDEFAIILESLGRVEDAAVVAQKVLHALARPFFEGNHRFDLSCSIGISFFLLNGTDATSLLAHADQAMYRAKQLGGNRYSQCTEDLGTPALARFHLISALDAALEREEFRLFFQPQVDVASGTVRGVEALVRWQHPEQGLVLPEAFLAVAEDSALIERLDEWILRTACAQLQRWRAAGLPPLQMAINLSPHQIIKPGLGARIAAVLGQSGLPSSVLELDVKGAPLVQDVQASAATLHDLKDLGLRLALDDFGDGHSAISYLRRLPFDIVKLDRAMIKGTGQRGPERIIALALTELAHSLAFTVVAVGVETPGQLSFVREAGCDAVQGHLISLPLDSAAIPAWIEDSAAQPALPAPSSARRRPPGTRERRPQPGS
jgi:diguanylate cyclase (GGDEF)-like protein